jgi:hypothetical protein
MSTKHERAKITAERRQLCVDFPLFVDRLFRAGLLRTAQRAQDAVHEIGWEVADLETKAGVSRG